jgi:hypothetical protein
MKHLLGKNKVIIADVYLGVCLIEKGAFCVKELLTR